ncbi:hypothetical protein V7O66_06555 [Methanolobus sp. ZRKC3]
MQNVIATNMTLEKNVLEWIDHSRGIAKRSTYVNQILKEKMNQKIA